MAIYVLIKTLEDNKKNQTRGKVIGFCNLITEKGAAFAQRYEETIYEASVYLTTREKSIKQENVWIILNDENGRIL